LAFCRRIFEFVAPLVFLFPSFSLAQSKFASGAGDCNAPASDPITYVALPGHPFGTAITRDGCWAFVSLTSANPKSLNGIALLQRAAGKITLKKVFPLGEDTAGIVLTHDNRLLIVANDTFVTFMDVGRMLSGEGNPVAGYIRDERFPSSVEVNVTSDDKFLFASDESARTITVINLQKARAENFTAAAIVGKIPVGEAPIALVFSPDEKLLYSTSEVALESFGWPIECKPEGGDPATAKPVTPQGAIIVVDVERAKLDPAKSVVAKVPAGCTPVRLAISPRGEYIYVTARNANAMLAFSTSKLTSDPSNALVGKVPVGAAPVPIAVADGGKRILVGNSNRFAAGENDTQDVTVIDSTKISSGSAAVLGTVPAQSFPREFGSSADGNTLFLANYVSNSLEIIDVDRLPVRLKQSISTK
jgi:DNA-binding beta-propeller fold protein YncE